MIRCKIVTKFRNCKRKTVRAQGGCQMKSLAGHTTERAAQSSVACRHFRRSVKSKLGFFQHGGRVGLCGLQFDFPSATRVFAPRERAGDCPRREAGDRPVVVTLENNLQPEKHKRIHAHANNLFSELKASDANSETCDRNMAHTICMCTTLWWVACSCGNGDSIPKYRIKRRSNVLWV